MSENKSPFEGIIIASFAWAVVGPLTMKYFADYGATVVRIETNKRPCVGRISTPYRDGKPGINRSGYFNHFSANTLSMALDMNHPAARDVALELISKSDVVMENFTPGVMEKWGLTYEEAKKVKPDIIMLRQSGFGSWGPSSQQPAFGMILSAAAGLPNFTAYSNGMPLPLGVSAYTDCISPRFAAAALISALDYRNRTGRGQLLELSQFETSLYFIMPAILDYEVNNREPARIGNASPFGAPHGVYPCKGEDRWCAISVENEGQWENLCRVTGIREEANIKKFDTILRRKQNEEELNALISRWTSQFMAEEVMEKLQSAGVPAGVIKNAAEVFADPQLRERKLFWPIKHPDMGVFNHLGAGFGLSRTPAKTKSPSPRLGEHTEYVCSKILGMTDERFVQLLAQGVFE